MYIHGLIKSFRHCSLSAGFSLRLASCTNLQRPHTSCRNIILEFFTCSTLWYIGHCSFVISIPATFAHQLLVMAIRCWHVVWKVYKLCKNIILNKYSWKLVCVIKLKATFKSRKWWAKCNQFDLKGWLLRAQMDFSEWQFVWQENVYKEMESEASSLKPKVFLAFYLKSKSFLRSLFQCQAFINFHAM